jgi:hypothetical protein
VKTWRAERRGAGDSELDLPSGQPENLSEIQGEVSQSEQDMAVNAVQDLASNLAGGDGTVFPSTDRADKETNSSVASNTQADLSATIWNSLQGDRKEREGIRLEDKRENDKIRQEDREKLEKLQSDIVKKSEQLLKQFR